MLQQTIDKMNKMKLSAMAQSLEERLSKGDHRDLSIEDFIGLLIDDEYTTRSNRKIKKTIGRANFGPENACIENIDYTTSRSFSKADMLEYTKSTWITNKTNLIFTGLTGTGKTYLAEAIGKNACLMGYSAMKIRFKRLFEEIKISNLTGQYLKYLDKLLKIDILILDDFLIQQVSGKEAADLMEIIDSRMQLKSTIITSQYPPAKWHERLTDLTLADGICDRLIHSSQLYILKGNSMRKK